MPDNSPDDASVGLSARDVFDALDSGDPDALAEVERRLKEILVHRANLVSPQDEKLALDAARGAVSELWVDKNAGKLVWEGEDKSLRVMLTILQKHRREQAKATRGRKTVSIDAPIRRPPSAK